VRPAIHVGPARWGVVVALVIVGLVAGCELASTTAPAIEQRAVVHVVLNPTATQQVIVVEKTMRSVTLTNNGPSSYQPITDARVVIYGPRGDSAVGVRSTAGDPGRYRIQSVTITDGSPGTADPNVLRLRPGERYRLRVQTSLGVVTGETTVPIGGPLDALRRTFNVDRDTLRLNSAAVRNAAGYLLRLETQFGAQEKFTTSADKPLVLPLAQVQELPADDAWLFSWIRPLIYPGLPETFVVVALDSNYFRYYEAGFDPFGDDTRGNSLTGGVGMFGSVATVMNKTLDLVADVDSLIEGVWQGDATSPTMPISLTLYSSPYFPGSRPTGTSTVSGTGRLFNGRVLDAFGTLERNLVVVRFVDPTGGLQDALANGQLSVDGILVLTSARTGERVTYRKR
jgi:uncharacterized protein DUF4249